MDLLLAGYLVVVSVVAVVRAPGLPNCWWLLAAHALFGLLLYLVTRPGLGPLGRSIREIYPLLLLVSLYSELDVLNGPGGTAVHDATVQGWELAIFGAQLSTEWWRAMPEPLLVGGAPRGVPLLLPHRRRRRRSTSPGTATSPPCAISFWW